MSNQLQITGGAKVRNLEGVLTGTSGVVSSLGINVPSGIPQLDGSGKILVSQLPNSVMEYKGTWDAATNTPTLANGTGNQGDVYLCNVAGTVNFGAGPISFNVGDQVIYSGTIWQRASGATGTVTSVALTESGDALTITGSPITTSGTINIGFAGTSGQYINGAGGLTIFPSFVSSVGLTTTSPALTITNSPITSSGNIELNFAGTGLQYIKGDGTLATFPTTIDQAKRLITEVYNSTGATLTKGTVVYINGGQGNLPTVTKAQANNDANSAQTYGVVQSDITNNNNGFVVVLGSLTDLDTQAYAVGTQLYLSGTTAGAWTSTKPSAPIHLVYVAIVVRSHPTQGVVEVRIQNGYELEELHDVAISSPVNNQGIFYNSSNDLWENKSIATALGYTPANDALVVKLAGTQTITGAKTFSSVITGDAGIILKEGVVPSLVGYTGLAGDADGLVITKRVGATAYTNLLSFTTSTSNTYTFPNTSGTIALLEGTQTFTGDKTFNGSVDFNNSAYLNAGVFFRNNVIGSTLYTTFSISKSGNLETLNYLFPTGNSGRLVFNDAATYTYTFPTTSGTIALLEGSQTFTGEKVFNNNALFNSVLSVNYGAWLQKGVPSATFSSAFTTLYSEVGAINAVFRDNTNQAKLQFQSASNYTYTFPAASGTLALTSDLSSYVTLSTTQTISGQKTFSGGVLIDTGSILIKNGINATTAGYTGFGVSTSGTTDSFRLYFGSGQNSGFNFTNTGTYTYTLPASTGTLVLGTGTTNYLPKFTGASTLGNSLIFDNGTNVGISNASPSYKLDVNGTFRIVTPNRSFFVTTNSYSISDGTLSSGFGMDGSGMYLGNVTSSTGWTISNPQVTILSSGNVGIGTISPNAAAYAGRVLTIGNGTSFENALELNGYNTTNDTLSDVAFLNGASSDADKRVCIVRANRSGANNSGALLFYTKNSGTFGERMRISNTGNVGIGTSSPAQILDIVGTFRTRRTADTTQYIDIYASGGEGYIDAVNSAAATSQALVFRNGNSGGITERMRITSGGYTKVSNTGTYGSATSTAHEIVQSLSNYQIITNTHTGSTPYGIEVNFANADPNNATNWGLGFYAASPSFVWIYRIYSNGTIANRSDARWKKNIETTRSGYLEDLCKLRVVKYNWYNHEEDAPKELGLIAQEVEEVFPNLISYDKVTTKKQVEQEDGTFVEQDVEDGETRSIKISVLPYMLLKALQEANAKIEELSAKVSALENKS